MALVITRGKNFKVQLVSAEEEKKSSEKRKEVNSWRTSCRWLECVETPAQIGLVIVYLGIIEGFCEEEQRVMCDRHF
jgi:hypothetical protein